MEPKRVQIIQGLAPIHRLIVYILKKLGRELGTVELVKIVYLIDIEFFKLFGRTLTGLNYIRHELGPYTRKISEAVTDLEEKEGKIIETHIVPSRGYSPIPKKSHKLGKEVKFEPGLRPEEQEVTSQVLRKMKNLSVKQLEKLAYETEPMRDILEKEKRAKVKLYGADLDFSLVKRDEFMKRWLANREKEKKNLEYDQFLEKEKSEFSRIAAQI